MYTLHYYMYPQILLYFVRQLGLASTYTVLFKYKIFSSTVSGLIQCDL